jgi:hypothetical protein
VILNDDATPARRSRASAVLEGLIALGVFEPEALAAELVTDRNTLEEWASATRVMPLDRQLVLAQLVVDRVPAMRREGHRLLGQVRAAIEFENGSTARSVEPPNRYRRT